jgi:hypothetical protein
MPSLAHLCAGGLAVVLLMDYMAVPAPTGPNSSQQSFHAQAPMLRHVVDRTHKGDRMSPRDTSNVQPVERTRPLPSRIPVGCDPAFSPLTGPSRANFTGRCLADNSLARRVVAALQ